MNVRPEPSQTSQDAEPASPIYFIGGAEPLPEDATPAVLGFKAFNLAQMAAIGLNVPPAFVLGTGWCARQEMLTADMWNGGLAHLERFGRRHVRHADGERGRDVLVRGE